jgi:hypothetical protein
VSAPDGARRALRQRSGPPPSTVLLLGSDAELKELGLAGTDATTLARRGSHRLVRLPATRLTEGRDHG